MAEGTGRSVAPSRDSTDCSGIINIPPWKDISERTVPNKLRIKDHKYLKKYWC